MITFDKLKLVADITAVVNYEESQFEKIEKGGSRTFKYYQETPYLLAIKIDYQEREVVVEFTGKVLGKDYPKLISLRNRMNIININLGTQDGDASFGINTEDAEMGNESVTINVG